jgi:hypothetical protein
VTSSAPFTRWDPGLRRDDGKGLALSAFPKASAFGGLGLGSRRLGGRGGGGRFLRARVAALGDAGGLAGAPAQVISFARRTAPRRTTSIVSMFGE